MPDQLTTDEHWLITRACTCPMDAKRDERCTRNICRCEGSIQKTIAIHDAKRKAEMTKAAAKKKAADKKEALNARTVRARVATIGDVGVNYPESAHGLEDRLWQDVLEAITTSRSITRAKALAEAALTSCNLKFPRRGA